MLFGDAWSLADDLEPESIDCIVTSPPYWALRDYGHEGQFGLEPTPQEYVAKLVDLFERLRPKLTESATVWLNLGDSYASDTKGSGGMGKSTLGVQSGGHGISPEGVDRSQHRQQTNTTTRLAHGLKTKDLCGIPWRVAVALQDAGWYLRSDIIWSKPNPMPESVTDRPTKSHEYVFLLTKNARYFFDQDAVREETDDPRAGFTQSACGDKIVSADGVFDHATRKGLMRERFYAPTRNIRTVWDIATQPFTGKKQIVRQVPVELDAVDDDSLRTASPDCPVHEWTGQTGPTRVGDEHGGCSPSRKTGTDDRRGSAPLHEPAPTLLSTDAETTDGSSGSADLPRDPSASPRSSQSHRTDHAHGTTPPCKPSERTPDRIDGKSDPLVSDGQVQHNPASSTAPDGSGVRSSDQTDSHSARKSSCTCSYHRLVTESISHFAVFPQALAERCIKAGTSERGVCPECGKPWERMVESEQLVPWSERKANGGGSGSIENGHNASHGKGMSHTLGARTTTTGWQPTCDHTAEPIPATVLDPFTGSGTTLYMARKLGRDSVGFELNEEYRELIEERLQQGVLL